MKEVQAFKTNDGRLFQCESKAKEHENNLIGEEIDAFLTYAISVTHGNVTHIDKYRMAIHLLENRQETAKFCRSILKMMGED